MGKFIAGLLALLVAFPTPAYAAQTIVRAQDSEGFLTLRNLLIDSGGETTGGAAAPYWTASGGGFNLTTTSTKVARGNHALLFDASAASQTVTATAVAIPDGMKGRNGVVSCVFKATTGTATHTLTADDGSGNNFATPVTIASSTTSFQRTSVNFIFPTSGNVRLKITSAADEPETAIDDCYLGLADGFNVGTTVPISAWQSYTPTFGGFGTGGSAPTNVNFTWRQVGDSVQINGKFTTGTTAASTAFVSLPNSYTSTTGARKKVGVALYHATNGQGWGVFAAQGDTNLTFGGFSGTNNPDTDVNGSSMASASVVITVDATVPVSQLSGSATAFRADQVIAPTVQKFTSGSGTYTKPNNATYIKVRMVGGGGGGAGGGTASQGSGGAGGTTTFGSSLLTANGGSGATGANNTSGASGGTASLGTGPVGTALTGGSGGSSSSASANTIGDGGGIGGSSALGGSGAGGGYSQAGGAGVTNTGAGGGGGGNGANSSLASSGAGGGAGGFVDAIISNPSSTYAYAVGAAGTAGTAGTNGFAGGAGGAGYIEVTEYYGNNAPILVGGSAYYDGYHGNDCSWSRTGGTGLGAPATDATCTLNQVQSYGVGTVTSALSGGNTLPGITLTNPSVLGRYKLTVTFTQYCATATAQIISKLQQDGVGVDDSSYRCAQSNDSRRVPLQAIVNVTGTTTFDIWIESTSGATTIDQENGDQVRIVKWDLHYIGP